MSLPLKWHGGKRYLAARIVGLMPPGHVHYVEPFFGGGAVLLAKSPEGVSEVVNDIDGHLITFWRVLACPVQFPRFVRLCEATPMSEDSWQIASVVLEQEDDDDEAYQAWAFFVHCRQSMAGRRREFTRLTRRRTRRGMNGEASAWLSAVDGLAEAHERLRRVVVLNRDALDVIRENDGERTLFYLDPPYLRETRTSPDVYRHELTDEGHAALLDVLKRCKGKVMLSGYRSPLYDGALSSRGGWTRHDWEIPNSAAGGKTKRRMTECLWCNF